MSVAEMCRAMAALPQQTRVAHLYRCATSRAPSPVPPNPDLQECPVGSPITTPPNVRRPDGAATSLERRRRPNDIIQHMRSADSQYSLVRAYGGDMVDPEPVPCPGGTKYLFDINC